MTNANEVIQRVKALRREDSVVFALFSDLHTHRVDEGSVLLLADTLDEICHAILPDAVIDLGDNLAMLGREEHITNEGVVDILTRLFDTLRERSECPLYLINGNHDAVGTDFFKPELWNRIVRGKYDGGNARYHTEGSYYYVDCDAAKTRLVFLSIPSESDITVENPTPLWLFGKEQLRWLEEIALCTDYDVLLFSHVPIYDEYRGDMTSMLEVWDGEKTAMSYISALCGWIEDRDEAVDIIKKRGNVRACFSGHTHTDSLWAPYEEKDGFQNPLPCYQAVTRMPTRKNVQTKEYELAIDVLVWTPSECSLHLVRCGVGEDRLVPCER